MSDVEKVTELEGQVTDMEAQVADLTKKLETLTKVDDKAAEVVKLTTQIDEMTKALEDATVAIEQLSLQKAEFEAIAKLSSDEKDHCAGMSADDKASFVAMSQADRAKAMKKSADADEVVVLEGQTIKKSLVGEAPFAVMKAQSERIKKNEADLAIEKAARETVVFEKRAGDEFAHVAGTVQERGAMISAIEKMEEPLKKSFLAVLTASEKLAKMAFDRVGHGGGTDPTKDNTDINKAARDFDAKVNEIKKRDSCTKTQALAKARTEHPDLFKIYQGVEEGGAAKN